MPPIGPLPGIPTDWQRSGYNVRAKSLPLLTDLIGAVDAPFVLLSYNNEGFVPSADLRAMLARFGRVEVVETPYTAFRGSRNFDHRPIGVTEQLFLIDKE